MGKKKVIEKDQEEIPEPETSEVETLDEEVEAFDLEEIPETEEEGMSDLEQDLMGEEEVLFEEEIQEERFYTVPLAKKGFERVPRWKSAKKAVSVLRQFFFLYMKPEGEVFIAQDINERIWENGIKNPPRKIRIRVTKSIDGIVRAYLA